MSQAARLNDPIGHSPSMSWLLTGLAAGAAIGVGAIAIAGTGGLAAAAVVGGLAAGGAGIGELFSTMSWAPKEICGVIKDECSGNVFTNGIPAARAHVDVVDCYKHSPPYPPIATGSATVFINGHPAARVNDKTGCSAVITSGSNNVYIGGDTMQTDVLQPEKLVPDAVHAGLLVVGIGSAIVLGGPIVAAAGFAGGAVGQSVGEWLGGKVCGIGSDGQKWAMLGGSLLGGTVAAKGSAVQAGKWIKSPLSTTQEFAKGGISGVKSVVTYPEGLAYRTNLPSHLFGPDGFTRTGHLSGTHNLNNAISSLERVSANYKLKPTSTSGILELSYDYVNARGKTIAGSKTVYDPSRYSDKVMLDLSLMAGQQGFKNYLLNPKETRFDINQKGINFRSYVNFDPTTGEPFVGNVHPIE